MSVSLSCRALRGPHVTVRGNAQKYYCSPYGSRALSGRERRWKGGGNFLEKGGAPTFSPPFHRPPFPPSSKIFILIESLIPTLAVHDRYGFESFFLLKSTQRHRQKSPSAYEVGPFFISTIGNRDSIKSKVLGKEGWGTGEGFPPFPRTPPTPQTGNEA